MSDSTPPPSGAHAARPEEQPAPTAPLWVAPPAAPTTPQQAPEARIPAWLWPVVAALALVVGVVAGAAGGLISARLLDTDAGVFGGLHDTVTTAPLPEQNGSIAAVARELLPSTVQIVASVEGQPGEATGSGFVIDRRGHIITNNHVVASAADASGHIEVVDQDGDRYAATLVGRSPVYDLAVLYAGAARGLRPAALGQSRRLQVGEGVVAIGSPLGLASTVTAGIVSAVNRPVTTSDSADNASFINAVQTDAAINPGNSGGPLVNLAGQVVGVNSAIATTGGSAESGNIGVGFAIPIEQVQVTADQILRDGKAHYPVIGASVDTATNDGRGAVVTEVQSGTPASRAGLRSGDVITEVNQSRVFDGIGLIVAIRSHRPGDTISLTFLRDDTEKTIDVVLGSHVG